MGNRNLYLTAEEAARILGVRVPTLYAYVSRKLIRSARLRIKNNFDYRGWAVLSRTRRRRVVEARHDRGVSGNDVGDG